MAARYAARGDYRPDSDIDLLVDFDEDSSLFDLMRMSREPRPPR